jgi:hypothetical protein
VKAFDAPTNQGLIDITELANEVAGKVNLTDFLGDNQSLAIRGWQKLPGGLILQWESLADTSSTSGTKLFPIAFPNAALVMYATDSKASFSPALIGCNITSVAGFSWYSLNSTTGTGLPPDGWAWLAIGC